MANSWPEVELGAVATLQRGFDLPIQKRMPGRVPIVSSSGISGYHSQPAVRGPGVITGRYGTIGQVFLVTEDFWPLNTTLWVKDFHGNDPRFVAYLLRTIDFHSCSDKSSVPGVNRNDLHRLAVLLPALAEQKRIAHVLGTLDDKIDLNRRMSATLEAMSRAIFKSWFVDFDPVRQKAAGKQPVGMDAQTAALFPDSFEDSEIGEVPKGWRVLALPEVADIMSGGTPRKSDAAFWGGDIPWVSPKVMTHIHVDDSIDRVTQAAVGNGTRLVPAGAVLVMVRGMGLHDGVRVSQAKCPVTFNQDVKALVATGIPATHLLYWMLHEASSLLTKVQTSGHGTGVLPTDFLTKLMTVIPGSNDEVNRLVACLEGLDAQLVSLVTQEKTLAALRDALLPKLLSGEVRVSEAEGMVEEAVG
jgi:type I restriction enzyme, S subunit